MNEYFILNCYWGETQWMKSRNIREIMEKLDLEMVEFFPIDLPHMFHFKNMDGEDVIVTIADKRMTSYRR